MLITKNKSGHEEDPQKNVEATLKKEEEKVTHEFSSFIVNLQDTGGKRYLKANIVVELESLAVDKEVEMKDAQLRDAILILLSSKKFEDIKQLEGKLQLRSELIFKINQLLVTGKANALYFTEFVVQ
ncbi:MAG: flagellar basal body-associated FliL family protein [Pseudomonadota bacterium]